MELPSKSIAESREELMASPTIQGNPSLRKSHFLKPSIDPNCDPSSHLSSPSLPPSFDPKAWPLTVNFYGWLNPTKNWKEWVHKMASLHAPTWKKAGIYEAILNSTHRFYRNDELVFGVSERWNPDTNSFVFTWGEATITLEDMLIAGYSVLGSPVFEPIEAEESKAIEEALIGERLQLNKSKVRKPLHCSWLKVFKDSGSEIEHEAFLSMWLSRFVFPTSRDVISKCVFPIAIRLARGARIALAPAVLATIYRDLSLLREKIVSLSALDGKSDERAEVTTWAPFQLVLVWVWERFAELSPEPNLIKTGEPRFAQWDNLTCKFENVRSVLCSSKDSFKWRPYTKKVANWDMPKFYRERESWVSPDSGVGDDVLSFIRCLRVSELVGLGCIEQYLPHRVARQLGFDQDIPGFVARCNADNKDAWDFYDRSVSGLEFYIPSCSFEGGVTTRYLEWWDRSVSVQQQEKNAEVTPEVSKEKEGKKVLSSRGICPGTSKRKRALGELMEVSAKSSERKNDGKTSKTPVKKKAAGELTGWKGSAEKIKIDSASKRPANSEGKKKLETSKSPTKKAEEINGSKVSAKGAKRVRKNETRKSPIKEEAADKMKVAADAECIKPHLPSETSESLRQSAKRKVSGEASVAQVKQSKKSKSLAEIFCAQNKESNKPTTNLVETNNSSVSPGFPSETGDPTADENTTIAEMIKCNKKSNASANNQCASGKVLAGKADKDLCLVVDLKIAKHSESEPIENGEESERKTTSGESHSHSPSPSDNRTSKESVEEGSETTESKQTQSNGNVSGISQESQSHLLENDKGIETATQSDKLQSHEEVEAPKQAPVEETVLPEGTEHVENNGDDNPNSAADIEDLKAPEPATSVEKGMLSEPAEKGQSFGIEDAPRELDGSEGHLSSVEGNETPKEPELPEKVESIETGSPTTPNHCNVGALAENGIDRSNRYDVLEERIDKLAKRMAERKAAFFQIHFG